MEETNRTSSVSRNICFKICEKSEQNYRECCELTRNCFFLFSLLKVQRRFDLLFGNRNLALKTRWNKCCSKFEVNKFHVYRFKIFEVFG